MLTFKAETLELIARGEPLGTVASHICRSIEQCFPGVVCSILTVDRGGILHPLSAPSLPESYSTALDNLAAGPEVGSCGSAAYSGQQVEVRDIASDPRWKGYGEPLAALGLKACWSAPLVDASGYVTATMALYFSECRGPTTDERALAALGMHLCDLALARHSRVEERERRATLDVLTGLPNRGSFERTLAHLNCSIQQSWGIFLVDLDNLKITNDTFGHAAGDALLQEVAARLARCAVPDRAFRIGGDEFAILTMGPEALAAPEAKAADILAEIRRPIEFEAFTLIPTATIGSAITCGSTADASAVYRNADTALYHAKETQPGSHVRFHSNLETRITMRMSSIEAVETALREDRIEAWYQPIVNLKTERIAGFEALCRMITWNGDIIPASVFAEATADARIASAFTRRMLSQVAHDMRQWRERHIPICPVSINVTAVDLCGGRLVETLDKEFAGDQDLLRKLVLEVTEDVCLGKRANLMIDVIHAVRERGVRIALDDFGTGYASLTHLLSWPVDVIKIDKSFVDGLPHDELSGTIISSIVSIANKLGAQVMAEGVETEEQAAMLTVLGCTGCQGFLYRPSLPPSEASLLAMRHAAASERAFPLLHRHTLPGDEVFVSDEGS